MIRINSQVVCYLTPEASVALKNLKDKGLDEDLALTLLEAIVPEHELYSLDEPDGTATC